jgi:hypothetical protein
LIPLVAPRPRVCHATDSEERRAASREASVSDRCHVSRPLEVARLSDRQADRERRERNLLEAGITTATDTLLAHLDRSYVGRGIDGQVLVVATYGDPFAGDPAHPQRGQSVPVYAHFASLRNDKPITDEQRRYLALESARAVSPHLRAGLVTALAVLEVLDALQARAGKGDEEARRRYRLILAALASESSHPGDDTVPPGSHGS